MAEKWIQQAHLKKGTFTAKAKAAGKSVGAMIKGSLKEGSKASEKTKHQAQAAKNLRAIARKK